MKRILLVMLMFIGMNVFAQDYVPISTKMERTYNQIDDNYFSVVIRNAEGDVHQTGFYTSGDDKLLRDGLWKLYDSNGSILTTALFENDKVVWIKADGIKYTSSEIELHRLRRRVVQLETLIAGTN